MDAIRLTDIEGIYCGHATNTEAGTGCTVIVAPEGAVCGVDVRGGGPATRETDLLRPENMVEKVHAVVLSGGSAYGLECACGVMEGLEEAGYGFDTGIARVPIVPAACLFDLAVGAPDIRPDKYLGRAALQAALDRRPLEEGNVGAGTGASVGKMLGPARAMKSGVGTFGFQVGELQVAAIVAVNAVGTVVDAEGNPMAGCTSEDLSHVLSPNAALAALESGEDSGATGMPLPTNTTISCVVTNANLTKAQATKVAQMAHDAYARTIRPVHTTNDGDTIFVLATGGIDCLVDAVGILAEDALEVAIRRGVTTATGAFGLKAYVDFE